MIKVSGKIHSNLLKREVRTGDEIQASDQLAFDNRNAYIHVINPQGRKTIRDIPDQSPRELMFLLEKHLAKNKKYLKSRGSLNKYIESLSGKLAHDTLLILGKGRINIDTAQLSLKKPAGIIASYPSGPGQLERLISDASSFLLNRTQLFGDEITDAYPKVTVQYVRDVTDSFFSSTVLIGIFTPYYTDETMLKKEVSAILRSFSSMQDKSPERLEEVYDYLASEYAPPVEENLKEWLAENNLL